MDSKKRDIIIALMVAMFLGAVEGTVVTTAIPTIVKDLKGFELISWVFSVYFLTSAIATPIYGKLADLFGRKNILTIGIIIFVGGSALCGFSQNMYQLILFRTVQGIGAGSIFTVTYTIVADVFSLEERAKVQGLISSVWGIASIAGPLIGGIIIEKLSWHWVFFINIPFGILSVYLLQTNFEEHFHKKSHKIDYLGATVLSLAIGSLLYGFLTGENNSIGFANTVLISVVLSAALLVLFYFVEKNASEPILPFDIFTKTSINVNAISFIVSAVLIGADVYLTLYVQYVLGYNAMICGFALAPISIGWISASFILGKQLSKHGEKLITLASLLLLLISVVLFITLKANSSLILVVIYSFIMGLGLGGAFTVLTIVVQSSVEPRKRGVATSTNSLVRTLGQAIAISVFGGIFNFAITNYFKGQGISGIVANTLYSSNGAAEGISELHIKSSLMSGYYILFVIFIILTAISVIMSLAMTSELKNTK